MISLRHLVSIVVPIYNVEKYLQQCLESIINQTYKHIEILLVNDGSTDNSGKIAEEYAVIDNRIKVIHKKNGGLSSARNAGINKAKGKYIAFIDSDDWIELEFIQVLVNSAEEYNSDIIQCGFLREYTDNKNSFGGNSNKPIINVYTGKEAINDLFNKRNITVMAWNKLYNIKLFNKIRYPENLIHEDEAVIHELLYNSNKVITINTLLYHYRIRSNSITQLSFNPAKMDIIDALENRKNYFAEKNERDFEDLTDKSYFRALLNVLSLLYFSKFENKNYYELIIRNKIKLNLGAFNKNRYFQSLDRLLLILYKVSPILDIYTIKLINIVKDVKYKWKI